MNVDSEHVAVDHTLKVYMKGKVRVSRRGATDFLFQHLVVEVWLAIDDSLIGSRCSDETVGVIGV